MTEDASGPVPVHYAGRKAELVISRVDDGVLRLQITARDPAESPVPRPASGVLVPFDATEVFRAGALDGKVEVRSGDLRLTVSPEPLTVKVAGADGNPVQQLVFESAGPTNAVGCPTTTRWHGRRTIQACP